MTMTMTKLGDIMTQECPNHPGVKRIFCGQCRPPAEQVDDDDNGWSPFRRQDRDALLARAQEIRLQFPRRFAQATTDHPEALAWVDQFRLAFESGGDCESLPSLLLMGATGTGKTHTAYAILAEAIKAVRVNRAGYGSLPKWRALSHADLCATLRPGGAKVVPTGVPEWVGPTTTVDEPEARLAKLRGLDLLVVDDLGAVKITEWVEEANYRLINARYEDMRPTIFTTNLAPADLSEVLGDRITSRLAEACIRIVLDGPDRRRSTANRTR